MKINDLIKFRSDLFFDGAVQLLWTEQNHDRASQAARSFVFHGPKYHGVSKDTGIDSSYQLTDTASLLSDIVSRISDTSSNKNALSLAIAGYGSGKSHFAVALTSVLRNINSDDTQQILRNLNSVDASICNSTKQALEKLKKPALVIPLDGTGNFNLGNTLSSSLFRALRQAKLDDSPLRLLSPRFDDAANFVKRNFEVRKSEFTSRLENKDEEFIISELEARNEDVYALVDEIYYQANGSHIPVEGRESAQDLISNFCDYYCGDDGPYSRLVIIFDEFGRFLEYVAERPALAGDSALQQIFQGIQDNAQKSHFIGFIQYELKAYLARLGQRDAMHIQKYISRFDVAKKYYLSSNLETIIAHLLEKSDDNLLNSYLDNSLNESKSLHSLMASLLPGFKQIPVWNDPNEFEKVVVRGCWPLHPLTTWFLTRQQDIVQSRSAITFAKNVIDTISQSEALSNTRLISIPASTVISGEMLNELVAAERAHGGVAFDNLTATISNYAAQLDVIDKSILIAVVAAKKMRVVSSDQNIFDQLMQSFSGTSEEIYKEHLSKLEKDLGVLAWNSDLKQYELITDAATRGQYQKEFRQKVSSINKEIIREIFLSRAKALVGNLLQDITSSFGELKGIPTLEWAFSSHLANKNTIENEIEVSFSDWKLASKPDQAKGQVIYTYLDSDTDISDLKDKLQNVIDKQLMSSRCKAAPIWVILLTDLSGKVSQYLATLYVLEDSFNQQEKEKYSRFIPEERELATQGLNAALKEVIQDRISIFSGLEITSSRLLNDANSIFEQVYSSTVPFPFDGFSTRAGNGLSDAATLARALFGREVSSAWIDVQLQRLQNRVKEVLIRSWDVFDNQGRLKPLVGNVLIRDLIENLESLHKVTPERTLGADMKMLLSPPYGCNIASSSIILGLFVGKTNPPRAIQYHNRGVSLTDWLKEAFGTKGKFLDDEALNNTTVVYLKEDAETRWQLALQKCEAEKTYIGKSEQLKTLLLLRKSDPIPESLEGYFKVLELEAEKAKIEIDRHNVLLEDCDKRLENAFNRQNYSELFAVADIYLREQKNINSSPEKWTSSQIDNLDNNITQLKPIIEKISPNWIEQQTCNSLQQVSDFRSKMERAERTLTNLGLNNLARTLSGHTSEIIASVETRNRFKMTVDDSYGLSQLPAPDPSSKIRQIKDYINKAESLIDVLKVAEQSLNSPRDIINLRKQLEDKLVIWRNFVRSRQEDYVNLLSKEPGTLEEISDLIFSLADMKSQFSDTKDVNEISLRVTSANNLRFLHIQLKDIEGSTENIEARLRSFFDTQSLLNYENSNQDNEEVDEDLEDEITWINRCFEHYIKHRVDELSKLSYAWAESAIQKINFLEEDSSSLIKDDSLNSIKNFPMFLGSEDRIKVEKKIIEISKIRDVQIEKNRVIQSNQWINDIVKLVGNIQELSSSSCRELVDKIKVKPTFVSEIEYEKILHFKLELEKRIDEIDISDLLLRIENMTAEIRNAFFKELMARYRKN